MIIHEVEQNSPEWFVLRLGIPTASNFKRIITPTGKPSTQADGYMDELLAEQMTGEHDAIDQTGYMARGNELQDSAAELYAFKHPEYEMVRAGFVTNDAKTMGCSPDMIIGQEGGLEIKCLKPKNHVSQLLAQSIDEEHKPQVQGSLLVTGAQWWDVIGYHPKMQPVIIRVQRDEAYINQMDRLIKEFHVKMAEKKAKLIRMGCEFHEQ